MSRSQLITSSNVPGSTHYHGIGGFGLGRGQGKRDLSDARPLLHLNSARILLSNLRSLSVTDTHFDWSDVANMLAHRWRLPTASLAPDGLQVAQLIQVRMDAGVGGHGNMNDHALAVMQGLKAEGMCMRIIPWLC
jgi:hypothetical protein